MWNFYIVGMINESEYPHIAQKQEFFVKGFFIKCDQIRRFLRICLHLLKKSLTENFISCEVIPAPLLCSMFVMFMSLLLYVLKFVNLHKIKKSNFLDRCINWSKFSSPLLFLKANPWWVKNVGCLYLFLYAGVQDY